MLNKILGTLYLAIFGLIASLATTLFSVFSSTPVCVAYFGCDYSRGFPMYFTIVTGDAGAYILYDYLLLDVLFWGICLYILIRIFKKFVTKIKPSTPSSTTRIPKVVTIFFKIIAFLLLGYAYFLIIGMGWSLTDSCTITDCTLLYLGLLAGFLLMFASLLFTINSMLYGKKVLSSTTLNVFLMPYIAIPIFIAFVLFMGTLIGWDI